MGQTESTPEVTEAKPTGGSGPEIWLNVYIPSQGSKPGVYHSGIEFNGVEYAYGGGSVQESGVYTQTPQENPPGGEWQFYLRQPLGKAKLDNIKAKSAINDLKLKFPADQYNVVRNNCNHFTTAAAKVLGVHSNYPSWVNRLAEMGSKMGIGEGQTAEVEETKTVFETTKGHTLGGSTEDVPIDPRTGRPNPWLKKKAPKPANNTTVTNEAVVNTAAAAE